MNNSDRRRPAFPRTRPSKVDKRARRGSRRHDVRARTTDTHRAASPHDRAPACARRAFGVGMAAVSHAMSPASDVRVHRAKIRAEAHRRFAHLARSPGRRGRVRHARRRHPPAVCAARARWSWGPRGRARVPARPARARASARSRNSPRCGLPYSDDSPAAAEKEVAFQRGPALRCTPRGPLAILLSASAGTSSPARCWTSAAPASTATSGAPRTEDVRARVLIPDGRGPCRAASGRRCVFERSNPGDAVHVEAQRELVFTCPSPSRDRPTDRAARRSWTAARFTDAANGPTRDAAEKSAADRSRRDPPAWKTSRPANTPLVTGAQAAGCADARRQGQCMLLTGELHEPLRARLERRRRAGARPVPRGGWRPSAVRRVYGAVGAAAADSGAAAFATLEEQGAVDFTVVSCAPDASLADRYAATCAAFAVAEARAAKARTCCWFWTTSPAWSGSRATWRA